METDQHFIRGHLHSLVEEEIVSGEIEEILIKGSVQGYSLKAIWATACNTDSNKTAC